MISPINRIHSISFKSNPVFDFNQNINSSNPVQSDSFDNQAKEDSEDFKRLHPNPNTAFMHKSCIPYEVKLEILAQHPEIRELSDIEIENNFMQDSLKMNRFFEIERLQQYKKLTRYFIDTSVEINRKNLNRIIENKDRLFSNIEYRTAYGSAKNSVASKVRTGQLKPFELYSKATGKLIPSSLYLVEGGVTKTGLSNVYKIDRRTKYFDKLVKFNSEPVYANIGSLSELGFGDAKTLFFLLKHGKLDGKISVIKTDNGPKFRGLVNLSSDKSVKVLKALRNRKCVEISESNNRFGLSKRELLDLFCLNKIDCYAEAVFIGDLGKVFIDMQSEKNHNAFNKSLFEKELLNGLNPDNFYTAKTCPRIKLAWYLSPKTRLIFEQMALSDATLISILEKRRIDEQQKLKFESENPDSFDNDNEVEESGLISEYSVNDTPEDIYIKDFMERFWQKAGYDEYNNALLQATKYIEADINEIDDPKLKNIITSSYPLSRNDFLNFV